MTVQEETNEIKALIEFVTKRKVSLFHLTGEAQALCLAYLAGEPKYRCYEHEITQIAKLTYNFFNKEHPGLANLKDEHDSNKV